MKLHGFTGVGLILLALILSLGMSTHNYKNVHTVDDLTDVVSVSMPRHANCNGCCKDAGICMVLCNAGYLCGQMAVSVDTVDNAFETAKFDVPFWLAGTDLVSSADPPPPKRHPLA